MELLYNRRKNRLVISKSWLLIFLLGCSFIFYLFSYPWPPRIRIIEILTGLFLILAFSKHYLKFICKLNKITIYKIYFYYFLFFGTTVGILNNNEVSDIIRDIIPLFYFFIGFAFLETGSVKEKKLVREILPYLMVILGLFYTFRILIYWGDNIYKIGRIHLRSQVYLAQSPSVTFTAAFLLYNGIYYIYHKKIIKGIFIFILSIFPLIVLSGEVLRAPIFLIILGSLYLIFFIVFSKRKIINKNNIYILILIFFISVIFFYYFDIIFSIFNKLINKFIQRGDNGKIGEYIQAFHYMSNNILKFLFGEGIGGLWITPFSKTIKFSYAHSFLVYSFIKGGLIGFFLSIIIVFKLIYFNIKRVLIKKSNLGDNIVYIATCITIVINLLLEVGYKTLSFGFIILILLLSEYKYSSSFSNSLE